MRFSLSGGMTSDLAGHASTRRHHSHAKKTEITKHMYTLVPDVVYYDSLKSRRWYNNALPRLFPIATYWLSAEKSTLSTRPSGVPEVGQFE